MQASPYSHLAQQFLELWQQQMSSVLNDREFIKSMVEMMQAMNVQEAKTNAKPAAANPSVPPDAVLERLDQLDYRLRMLEKRLAAMEGAKPSAGRSAGGAARRGKRAGKRKP